MPGIGKHRDFNVSNVKHCQDEQYRKNVGRHYDMARSIRRVKSGMKLPNPLAHPRPTQEQMDRARGMPPEFKFVPKPLSGTAKWLEIIANGAPLIGSSIKFVGSKLISYGSAASTESSAVGVRSEAGGQQGPSLGESSHARWNEAAGSARARTRTRKGKDEPPWTETAGSSGIVNRVEKTATNLMRGAYDGAQAMASGFYNLYNRLPPVNFGPVMVGGAAVPNPAAPEVTATVPPPAATSLASPTLDDGAIDELDNNAAYIRALQNSLRGWADYGKARQYAQSPYQILRAVFDHHQHSIPESFKLTADVSRLEDEGLLDEAALLYHELQNGGASGDSVVAPTLSPEQLRSRFLEVLRPDCAKRLALDRLLVFSPESTPQTPFFDGFTIRHACGKSFEQLVECPTLWTDSVFANLTIEGKRELLQAKFAEIGESTHYPIGTPEHSMESALIRIAKYRGQPVAPRFESEQALASAFQQVETEWNAQQSLYPMHPRLLLAKHLASASGVEVLDTAELSRRYDQILELAKRYRAIARPGEQANQGRTQRDWDPQIWLQSVPAKWNKDGRTWMNQEDSVKREALLSTFDALRDMSERSKRPPGVDAEEVWRFASQVKQAGLLGEVLIGDDWRGKAVALLTQTNKRLQAAFDPPPTFSREEGARKILKKFGMSDREIDRRRHYTMFDFARPERQGTAVEEFLDRVDNAVSRWDTLMRTDTQAFNPKDELQKEQQAFNDELSSHEWVLSKAAENLRQRSKPVTKSAVQVEAQRIASNYQTETENWRALKRAGLTMVNMAPFAGSGYNLIQGIIDKDVTQAVTGLFSLFTDFGFAFSGRISDALARRKASMTKVPPRQKAGIADTHRVATDLGVPAAANFADHAEVITLAEETPDISIRDGNVPAEHRVLATRVRNGESGVTWEGYDVVLLANEDRVVPVKHQGGSYHEIDWHTGHRRRHGRIIHRDTATGTFRTGAGLKGGIWGIGEPTDSAGRPIKKRLTSVQVREILAPATDVEVKNFNRLFEDCFSIIEARYDALNGWNVKAFFERLYQRSDTFRRLFNYYHLKTERAPRRWKLLFGEGNLGFRKFAEALPETREIILPAEREFRTKKMLFSSGTQSVSREHVVLHETMHMLTFNTPDPETATTDRGPVVYLTDKILSEAGFQVDERVLYSQDERLLQDATYDAFQENCYLDPYVDAKRTSVTADTLVEEQRVADRITVTQWKETQTRLDLAGIREGVTDTGDADWRTLKERFEFGGNRSQMAKMKRLETVTRRLLKKSPTFRALVRNMQQGGDEKWAFNFNAQAADAGTVGDVGIRLTKTIDLFDDNSQYLSSKGLRDMEYERKVTSAFVNAMTDLRMPNEPANLKYGNRGAAILIEDKILLESGYNFPKRIASALATDSASAAKLRTYQTSALRSATTEDVHIGSS